jgi:hypothetical protein
MVELQLLTQAREVISYLDYALLFKKLTSFRTQEHERWLRNLRLKANIFDAVQEWPDRSA